MLRVGDVAEAAGVNRETLRYYARRGLLASPHRRPGSDCCPIPFVDLAGPLGLTAPDQ